MIKYIFELLGMPFAVFLGALHGWQSYVEEVFKETATMPVLLDKAAFALIAGVIALVMKLLYTYLHRKLFPTKEKSNE